METDFSIMALRIAQEAEMEGFGNTAAAMRAVVENYLPMGQRISISEVQQTYTITTNVDGLWQE